jgi:hypothetical protein
VSVFSYLISVFSHWVIIWNPRNSMGCHGRLALETDREPMWCLEVEIFWVSPNVLLHCVM